MAHLKPVPDPEPKPADGKQPSIEELERYATVLRIHCVRMLAVAKSGHLDSSLSAAEREESRCPDLATASMRTQWMRSTVA